MQMQENKDTGAGGAAAPGSNQVVQGGQNTCTAVVPRSTLVVQRRQNTATNGVRRLNHSGRGRQGVSRRTGRSSASLSGRGRHFIRANRSHYDGDHAQARQNGGTVAASCSNQLVPVSAPAPVPVSVPIPVPVSVPIPVPVSVPIPVPVRGSQNIGISEAARFQQFLRQNQNTIPAESEIPEGQTSVIQVNDIISFLDSHSTVPITEIADYLQTRENLNINDILDYIEDHGGIPEADIARLYEYLFCHMVGTDIPQLVQYVQTFMALGGFDHHLLPYNPDDPHANEVEEQILWEDTIVNIALTAAEICEEEEAEEAAAAAAAGLIPNVPERQNPAQGNEPIIPGSGPGWTHFFTKN